ncbi:hypothetical Protein pso3_01720 [Candidatus Phytoplasma solani]
MHVFFTSFFLLIVFFIYKKNPERVVSSLMTYLGHFDKVFFVLCLFKKSLFS